MRLRTNLEVFWDQIQWARGRPDVQIRTFDIPTASADLHYRGYSSISAPPAGAPEIPDYDRVVGTRLQTRPVGVHQRVQRGSKRGKAERLSDALFAANEQREVQLLGLPLRHRGHPVQDQVTLVLVREQIGDVLEPNASVCIRDLSVRKGWAPPGVHV